MSAFTFHPGNSVILLTACISPGNAPFTALTDASVRLSQYLTALRFYLEQTSYRIIFCENSGYPFPCEEFSMFLRDGRLEILTFEGNSMTEHLGKGFGEVTIIEYALSHSRLLRCFPEEPYVLKITGRLIVQNLRQLCTSRLGNYFVRRGQRVIAVNLQPDLYTASEIVIAPVGFWMNCLVPGKGQLNDFTGFIFERLLATAIRENCHRYRVLPFYDRIQKIGVSATTGTPYQAVRESCLLLCIRWLRTYCRMLLQWNWGLGSSRQGR